MDWTIEQACGWIEEHGHIFNIGQLPKPVMRDLDKLVKKGLLVKQKACWPHWTHGTCTKTGWRLA